MAAIGTAFAQSVPTVGTLGTGYAATINLILQEIVDRLSAKVPTSSISAADADVNMNSAWSLTDALGLTLATLLAAPSGAPFGRLARYGGNLYYVDASGAVQITSGAGLNASGIGGLGGDYGGANPARLNFVDSTGLYEFYEDPSGSDWAGIKAEYADIVNGAFRSRIDSQATLDSIFSLPPDSPASGRSLVSISSAGLVDHDQAISNSPTLSADIILSGTAKVQFAAVKTKLFHPITTVLRDSAGVPAVEYSSSGSLGIAALGSTFYVGTSGGGAIFYVALDGLEVGTRITTLSARLGRPAAGTARIQLVRVTEAGAVTLIGTEGTSAATGDIEVSQAAVNHTVLTNNSYMALITLPNVDDKLRVTKVTYDQPA